MARCKHLDAKLVELLNPNGPHGFYRIRCDDCELTVMGIPYPVESRHACHRVSKPPKWCQHLIDQGTPPDPCHECGGDQISRESHEAFKARLPCQSCIGANCLSGRET